MKLLMACTTWADKNDSKIFEYIERCDIFPNIPMIVQATGLPEKTVRKTLDFIKRQENMLISRYAYLDSKYKGANKKDILILLLINGYEDNIRGFLEANRFYDDNGNILFRFTTEEVIRAVSEFKAPETKSDNPELAKKFENMMIDCDGDEDIFIP